MLTFITRSAKETEALGESVGYLLKAGDFILLSGQLGAGKTVFTRGIAQGLGVKDYVKSPSYTLVNEYEGRLLVYHMDLYRLESHEELEDLGYEEYFYGKGVTIVEWGERAGSLLPDDSLKVCIEVSADLSTYRTDEGVRLIYIEAEGERFRGLLEELSKDVRFRS